VVGPAGAPWWGRPVRRGGAGRAPWWGRLARGGGAGGQRATGPS